MTSDIRVSVDAVSFDALSDAARSAWAKSAPNPAPNGEIESWLPLYRHLADTAGIAARLWDEWLAPHTKRTLESAVGSASAARSLTIWLAGTHDVGKLSPAFSVQVTPLATRMIRNGLRLDPSIAGTERRREVRHELVSFLAIDDYLSKVHGLSQERSRALASIAAAHHGYPPSRATVRTARHDELYVGDAVWAAARREILDVLTPQLVSQPDLDVWRTAPLPAHSLVLLSSIVVVADWLASSDAHFPLADLAAADVDPGGRVDDAWRALDLPQPWLAQAPADDAELFNRRFGFPTPNEMQADVMRLARECESPSLMIIESAMGSGKTEAALAAAEILATRFGLSGVFIGLPTQATTDGMFSRVLKWTELLDLHAPLNVFLGHGKSRLNEEFDKRRTIGRLNTLGDHYGSKRGRQWAEQDEPALAHTWFSSPRRGPLADLVVGTIDQALFATLKSRHNALRHLALAGKVVILDEIHAFDAFVNVYIEQLLRWLAAYGVPVVLLSATLPAARREALTRAYRDGRTQAIAAATTETAEAPYPLVTLVDGSATRAVAPKLTGRRLTIAVEHVSDDLDELASLLQDELQGGGCAVVIRNTVNRVQATASVLRARLPEVPIIVAHSRFLGVDRARKDRELIEQFGKEGTRPTRAIVVASQVVEQSLDIDFDLMVTDVAPVDLVLQRAGRLHRHDRSDRPARLRTPRLLLSGADWAEDPPGLDRGGQKVYGRYLLLRTLAALSTRTMLTLPDDIPPLVQAVYSEHDDQPTTWRPAIIEARASFDAENADKRERASGFRIADPGAPRSLLGWADASAGDPSSNAQAEASVRDAEPTLEVLVLQEIEGVLVTPTWLADGGGEQIPDNGLPTPKLTRTILGSSLRLPAMMCRGKDLDDIIDALEAAYPVQAWHRSRALRGELVAVFDEDMTCTLGRFDLAYSPEDGLSVTLRTASAHTESEDRR